MIRTEAAKKKRLSNDLLSQQRGALMGISILLIMVFHFTEDCKSFHVHYSGIVQWFWTYIGSSSVDAFLFFSGLGLYYSMKKNPDIFEFYKRRLVKIIIPYFLVAFPAWIWFDLVIQHLGIKEVFKDFTFQTMCSGTRWYWYIFMILICYLIFPYIFHIVEEAGNEVEGEMWLLTLATSTVVLTFILKQYSGDFYANYEVALTRFPLFFAGCFYGRSSYEKRENYWKWGVLLAASVFALMILPTSLPILGRYIRGIMNVSLCAITAVIMDRVKRMPLKRILEWFGGCSLELYLVHVTIRKIMQVLGLRTCYVRYELLMIAVSILLAWLLNLLCRRLTPTFRKKECA